MVWGAYVEPHVDHSVVITMEENFAKARQSPMWTATTIANNSFHVISMLLCSGDQ